MNTKNNNLTTKLITIGKKFNKELGKEIYTENNNNNKKVIESYNSKNNEVHYMKKKINLETNTTFDKKTNLSLFSFLSSNTNQEEKTTNKSLKTTKDIETIQLNLKYAKSNNKKIFLNSTKINHNKKNKKIISNNYTHDNIILNKELDKFKNRIDNIMQIIEDFEAKYIFANENIFIRDELNKMTINKKYLNNNFNRYNNININNNLNININNISNINSNIYKSKNSIKSHHKQIYFRESNKNLLNKDKNNNKTVIIKNHKLNLINNPTFQNNCSSTKNIIKNKINNSITSNTMKNDKNKKYNNKKELKTNNKNSYDRRINYSSLIDVKYKNKEKSKKVKEKVNDINKKSNNSNKPLTYHYPSKSNDIRNIENLYNNEKKNKEKEIINNNICVSPSYNKTPKIYRVKEKINKKDKAKSNKNNINKKKKIIKNNNNNK